jgi:elongation of very long chain fatty acids protein 4|eukprot:CAMPEP_0174285722 /NCGR_PEP_ID=MMETSP0809-20121228/9503_1 /TAXON_ID=73025 ORGANISM="Eutreptiella gymnastica-like, Strain CCMP1594" /NCGR_SAMPLE_ID=MMETSP0809 /ASSEMBLY_ACC=CAM_ASM_000658 /LENGTH=303 /DNA_ID=CAMNT_0015381567 /DNA_START=18 /DNA_END=929 /DNA_ORIENTATION=-
MASKQAENDGVFNIGLLKPAAFFAADIAFLAYVRQKAMADVGKYNVFADSFFVPLGMNILYFMMIYFGTKAMKNREPFDIKQWMFAYNFMQTFINLAIVLGFMYEVHSTRMRYWGSGIDWSAKGVGLGFMVYAHYHNKYLEFCDTAFMILRKKSGQLSFLHVYHHSLLTWSWWLVVWRAPGGDAWYGACYNSFIHVLMYSYYLFATFGVRCPWKKFLTQFQMVQFICCFTHSVYVGFFTPEETYPKWLVFVQAFVMVNMLVLFGNFYRQSYRKKPVPAASKAKETESKTKEDPQGEKTPAVGR